MLMKIVRVIFSFLVAAWFYGTLAAQESAAQQGQQKGSINLNVNYPGAALRYFVADGKGLELLGQGQDDIFVGGLRYYHYPKKLRGAVFSPYAAVECDYLSFKGDYSKGKGWGGGLYAGVEYRLGGRFSLQADTGAMYVSVKDKSTDLMESGLEFLVNFGFNVYFGGGRP